VVAGLLLAGLPGSIGGGGGDPTSFQPSRPRPPFRLEIVTGNPRVFFRYPYPHLSKPLPLVEGTGLRQVRVRVPGGWEGTHTRKGNAHGSAVHRRR
jgi:hypothetical protein